MTGSTSVWNDGQLRETHLVTNGFPDKQVPRLPDELFLENNEGERVAEMCVDTTHPGPNGWWVYDSENNGERYHSFKTAFEHALLLSRKEAED